MIYPIHSEHKTSKPPGLRVMVSAGVERAVAIKVFPAAEAQIINDKSGQQIAQLCLIAVMMRQIIVIGGVIDPGGDKRVAW
jgi:hypothetical protein